TATCRTQSPSRERALRRCNAFPENPPPSISVACESFAIVSFCRLSRVWAEDFLRRDSRTLICCSGPERRANATQALTTNRRMETSRMADTAPTTQADAWNTTFTTYTQ